MIPSLQAGQVIEHRKGEFVLSTDRDRLDLDVIHAFLTRTVTGPKASPAKSSRVPSNIHSASEFTKRRSRSVLPV